jgi:[protein-PII] uridylyltransferase
LLTDEVRRLAGERFAADELQAHFAELPPRYFQIHSAKEILDDLELADRFLRQQISDEENPLSPTVNWHNEPDRGCNAVKICTWDRGGLFSKIAGSFSATGLNILGAQIFTRGDGIALDTFFVTDARTGNLADREQREEFQKVLNMVLCGGEMDLHALIARHKIIRPLYQAYMGEQIPTHIQFDNEASETRTVIEIETEDRVGLLYAISETLTLVEVNILGAKICTEKGAAIDTFYIQEMGGGKIVAPERQKKIETKLRQAIHALDVKA